MNIYVNGSWKSFNLTIPSSEVALLSGSSPPPAPTLLAGAGGLTGTGSVQWYAGGGGGSVHNYGTNIVGNGGSGIVVIRYVG